MNKTDYEEYLKTKDRPINEEYKLSQVKRIADQMMLPLMKLLGGFQPDILQETHHRHCITFPNNIPKDKFLEIIGNDSTWVKPKLAHGLHHMPYIGGRKKYIVIKNNDYKKNEPRYIGRKTTEFKTQIHILPIKNYDKQTTHKEDLIRMLVGPSGHPVRFFAINKAGEFLDIEEHDRGILEDMKYPDIRLF